MVEIVWQYDPSRPEQASPATAAEAKERLEAGNATFAALGSRDGASASHIISLAPADLGLGLQPGEVPDQTAFAAALCCSDARVPPELIFGQAANEIFVARVAGNVFGDVCIGSFEYAIDHIPTVRQLVVLGHTSCGALGAAVSSYVRPTGYLGIVALPALRTIVDSLLVAVLSADRSLQLVYGALITTHPAYRAVLADLAACLNAALGAHQLTRWFGARFGPSLSVAYGIYNLATRQVGLPSLAPGQPWAVGLAPPPAGEAQFHELAVSLARSAWIRARLEVTP